MNKIILLLFTFSLLSCQSNKNDKTDEINVLFIGNSLTYYHDMPTIVQKMLNETNPNIKITQSTFGGISLTGHIENIIVSKTENHTNTRKKTANEKTETEKIIASKNWDVIILQTGTVRLLIPETREFLVNTAIKKIQSLVKNPDCRFLLFTTWPSKKEYPKKYCYPGRIISDSLVADHNYCSPLMENLEQEINLINDSYAIAAKETKIEKSENGIIFNNAIINYPELELLEDDIHPSTLGAFLNACVFYQMLTGKKATELKFISDIDANQAIKLKMIAQYK